MNRKPGLSTLPEIDALIDSEPPMKVAASIASDLSPFGLALAEMIRRLYDLDQRLEDAVNVVKQQHGQKR